MNGPQLVRVFLNELTHPQKPAIEQAREIVLAASPQLTEHIKWRAPSFCQDGEDRITFNLRGTDSFRLIFHRGAKAKESQERLMDDATGLLTWLADDRAAATFTDLEDVNRKETALTEVVRNWIAATD